MKKQITKKEAREKYGIIVKRYHDYKYFLLDNGNVVDSDGDIRYMKPKQTEYNKIIDALNLIDQQAESGSQETYEELRARAKAYDKVANFIDKYAKR